MLLYATQLDSHKILNTDVCIIGSGAAGISLALSLLDSGLDVVMLESSYSEVPTPLSYRHLLETIDEWAQTLCEGEFSGFAADFPNNQYFLTNTRLRLYGGTTNYWSGWCRPMDACDFEPRPGVHPEGWPIREADLLPYMHRAMETCHLSDYVFDDPHYWIERFKQTQPPKELAILKPNETIQTVNWQVMDDPFLKFHATYGRVLEASRQLTIIRDATVQQLETNEAVSQVVSARARNSRCGPSPDRRQAGPGSLEIRAKQFAIAAGGIESVRLLLLSNQRQKEGLGNQSGLLGKYFMTHPIYLEAATYSGQGFPQPVRDFFNYNSVPGASFKVFAGLKPTAEFLRKTQSASWRVCFLGDGHQLNLNWEQIPNENSTISLGDEVDVFGQPKVKVNWALTPQDKQTVAHALTQTRNYLVKQGVADPEGWQNLVNIELDQPWTETLAAAGHHLGGCRMSSDPNRGVVDGTLRSHQLSNLSICSTAVFPSGGVSNPTLTLVALAHRLADRLRSQA